MPDHGFRHGCVTSHLVWARQLRSIKPEREASKRLLFLGRNGADDQWTHVRFGKLGRRG
jgi:hypothetical protein